MLNGTEQVQSNPAIVESAIASLTLTGWMQNRSLPASTISANQLTSLSAFISHVAHFWHMSEFRIERQLADRFNIPNTKCLPADKFDDAIRYLADQVPVDAAA